MYIFLFDVLLCKRKCHLLLLFQLMGTLFYSTPLHATNPQ